MNTRPFRILAVFALAGFFGASIGFAQDPPTSPEQKRTPAPATNPYDSPEPTLIVQQADGTRARSLEVDDVQRFVVCWLPLIAVGGALVGAVAILIELQGMSRVI